MWRAMTELYRAGRIKAIGVSNFKPHHLAALMKADVKPMVNQIEYHPGWMQQETVDFCKANGIVLEAWSPLGSGALLKEPKLEALAAKYGKTVAQLGSPKRFGAAAQVCDGKPHYLQHGNL